MRRNRALGNRRFLIIGVVSFSLLGLGGCKQLPSLVGESHTSYPQAEHTTETTEEEPDREGEVPREVSSMGAPENELARGAAAFFAENGDPRRSDEPQTLFDSTCAPFEGLEDQTLLDQVYEEVRGHTALGYRTARDHMYGLREPVIDIFDGTIECVYTGRIVRPDGTRTPEETNTEHSWPQSKGSREEPARSDIHHLFITDQTSNFRRSNLDYGMTDCNEAAADECRWEGPSIAGGSPSQLGLNAQGERIFEVRSQTRGNIARAQFYFSARYRMPIGPIVEDVLRRWHAEDPPDAREKERNRRIELVQGNRNVFVDCPDLVERIRDF